jgi:8-oxoguanine deaminase
MLIQGASAVKTGLADERASLSSDEGLDLRIAGGRISEIGHLTAQPNEAVLSARDCVIYPGWVNTHHHLFQSLLKGIPAAVNAPLIEWLSAVPVRYRRFFDHEEALRIAARVGLVELLLSGCTTVADHQYHYYPGMGFDASAVVFDEAEKLGMRFMLCRGGATKVRAIDQAPPPQAAPETIDAFMTSVDEIARRFHDPSPEAMRKVASAITTPTWSTEPQHLKLLARQARALGIRLHSHLSETFDYVRFCAEVHHCTPMQFVEQHEWVGSDVWFAHMVHLDAAEIARCAASGTGVAHCPQSNARLGSGIAPVPELLASGVPVALAVDGAASNEAADMISEAHACWLLHRANPTSASAQPGGRAWAMTVDQVINIGTQQGARMLGFDAVGRIEVGAAADLAIYRLDAPRTMGLHDPSIAPVVCAGSPSLAAVIINGKIVLQDNVVPGLDLARLRHDAARLVRSMVLS